MEIFKKEVVLIEIKVMINRKILVIIVVNFMEHVVVVEDFHIVEIKEKMAILDDEVVEVIHAVVNLTNLCLFIFDFFEFRSI